MQNHAQVKFSHILCLKKEISRTQVQYTWALDKPWALDLCLRV